MSIPINELVYAGVWSVSGYYPTFQFVLSPIDGNCYVNVGVQPSIGGPDPSNQPSAVWVLLNQVVSGGGITSLNGLTDSAMSIVSTDTSVGITPIAPNKVDLSVSGGFAPVYGSFSSTQTIPIPQALELPIAYDTKDCTAVGLNVLVPSADIQVLYKGTYKFLSSIQIDRTSGGTSTIIMYPRVNGTGLPNSATYLTTNQTTQDCLTIEWFMDLNANDSVSIAVYTPDADNRLLSAIAVFPVPAVPSIITTILRVG
jgi:hypothetical protein